MKMGQTVMVLLGPPGRGLQGGGARRPCCQHPRRLLPAAGQGLGRMVQLAAAGVVLTMRRRPGCLVAALQALQVTHQQRPPQRLQEPLGGPTAPTGCQSMDPSAEVWGWVQVRVQGRRMMRICAGPTAR